MGFRSRRRVPLYAMRRSGVSRRITIDLYLLLRPVHPVGLAERGAGNRGRWVGHLETTEGMISVARIVVRPSVLNKTRKWQNCGPTGQVMGILLKNSCGFNELAFMDWPFSKPHHGYVIVLAAAKKQWVTLWHRGPLVTETHYKFLQNSVVVGA